MHCIMHVELELGRELAHPFGERGHCYDLYLPLWPDGRLELEALRAGDPRHKVWRRRPGEEAACGVLVLDGEGRLHFSIDGHPSNRQLGFQTPPDRFVVGHSVAIAEEDGETHPFQIVAVRREQSAFR